MMACGIRSGRVALRARVTRRLSMYDRPASQDDDSLLRRRSLGMDSSEGVRSSFENVGLACMHGNQYGMTQRFCTIAPQ